MVALAGCLASLAGCSAGSPAASGRADAAFLSEVAASAPGITDLRSAGQLLGLGRAVCDAFAGGAGFQETADRLSTEEGSHPLPTEDLGAVISSAADNLCPRYRDRVSGS